MARVAPSEATSKVAVLLPPHFLPLEQPSFALRGGRVWNYTGKNLIAVENDLELCVRSGTDNQGGNLESIWVQEVLAEL